MPRPLLLSLALGVALAACDRGVIGEDATTGAAGDTAAAAPAADIGADAAAGEDAAAGAADTTAAATDATGGTGGTGAGTGTAAAFEIGWNETGKNTPSAFHALTDGDDLHIELGFQGAYMVVLAFRSKGHPTTALTVRASVEAAGTKLGSITLKGKSSLKGPDGWSYFYNLFVITEGWEALADGPGSATVSIETADGKSLASHTITGTIRPPPN